MDVPRPRAVEVHPAGVGVGRPTDAQRAVGVAAQHRTVAVHQVYLGIGPLVVLRQVDDEIPPRLPVSGDGVVAQRLIAVHPRPGAIAVQRIKFGIVYFEGRGRQAGGAIRGTHHVGVVAAGQERADRIEKGTVVLDVDYPPVVAAHGAVARGDPERLHGGGLHRRGGNKCDRIDAAGHAVIVPGQHLFVVRK